MGKLVTRLYDNFERAEDAMLELERAGVAQGEISLVSHQSGSGVAVSAALGGLLGTGGIAGALTNSGVSEEEADVYAEGVRRGGTLVSVTVEDEEAASVEAVLDRSRHVDIGRRREAYRGAGWTHFDDGAPIYSDDEAAAERESWLRRR